MAFTGSGPDRVSNDLSITDFRKDAGRIGSSSVSTETEERPLTSEQRTIYFKRYLRGYEILRRAGSDETILVPASGMEVSRIGFANQVINQQKTLEHYGLGEVAEKIRSVVNRKLAVQ